MNIQVDEDYLIKIRTTVLNKAVIVKCMCFPREGDSMKPTKFAYDASCAATQNSHLFQDKTKKTAREKYTWAMR